jgi:hypothetical protein
MNVFGNKIFWIYADGFGEVVCVWIYFSEVSGFVKPEIDC